MGFLWEDNGISRDEFGFLRQEYGIITEIPFSSSPNRKKNRLSFEISTTIVPISTPKPVANL